MESNTTLTEFIGTPFQAWNGFQPCETNSNCSIPGTDPLDTFRAICFGQYLDGVKTEVCACSLRYTGDECVDPGVEAYPLIGLFGIQFVLGFTFFFFSIVQVIVLLKNCSNGGTKVSNIIQYSLCLSFFFGVLHAIFEIKISLQYDFATFQFISTVITSGFFLASAFNYALLIAVWYEFVSSMKRLRNNKSGKFRKDIVISIFIVDFALAALVAMLCLSLKFSEAAFVITFMAVYHPIILSRLIKKLAKDKSGDDSSTGSVSQFINKSNIFAKRLIRIAVVQLLSGVLFILCVVAVLDRLKFVTVVIVEVLLVTIFLCVLATNASILLYTSASNKVLKQSRFTLAAMITRKEYKVGVSTSSFGASSGGSTQQPSTAN